MSTLNACWEFMRCGPEKKRDCQAFLQRRGGYCWLVSGTVCDQGAGESISKKVRRCRECNFYRYQNGELYTVARSPGFSGV